MPIYRFRKKLVLFIHVPKTGGSTIEAMMREAGGIQALFATGFKQIGKCNPQHYHHEVLRRLFPARFYDRSFAIVRNPISRLVSEYNMQASVRQTILPFGKWVEDAFEKSKKQPYLYDNHIRPQSEFIGPDTTVYKFEDGLFTAFTSELLKIDQKHNLKEAPHKKKSKPQKFEIKDDTLDKIRKFYEEDFRRFKY